MRPKLVIFNILALCLVAGCAAFGTQRAICPEPMDFPAKEQVPFAAAWNALDDASPLQKPLHDWERMRRACGMTKQ
jgi:hypothetical protein